MPNKTGATKKKTVQYNTVSHRNFNLFSKDDSALMQGVSAVSERFCGCFSRQNSPPRVPRARSEETYRRHSLPENRAPWRAANIVPQSPEETRRIKPRTRRISDASTPDEIPANEQRQIVVEVHQTHVSRVKAKDIPHQRAHSHESVIRRSRRPEEVRKQSFDVAVLGPDSNTQYNSKLPPVTNSIETLPTRLLLATGNIVREHVPQLRRPPYREAATIESAFADLSTRVIPRVHRELFDRHNSPPPPAPANSFEESLQHIVGLDDNYFNSILVYTDAQLTAELKFKRELYLFKCPEEIKLAGFQKLPPGHKIELPKVNPSSPQRQPRQSKYPREYIDDPPKGSNEGASTKNLELTYKEDLIEPDIVEANEPGQSGEDTFPDEVEEEDERAEKLKAREFLNLSPDFSKEFDRAKFIFQPEEHLSRPIEERFLERRPADVQIPGSPVRSLTPSPRRKRKNRPPPPASRFPKVTKELRAYIDFTIMMSSLDDHERKVIIEFCHLLEKSKQLFNGLRELPQYGHKQWHSYFGRTFDVYTKLWKFQQQHRAILDTKYGLKRWQIGEIASKIGQLYYHFYLRTSETAYLTEAYSFYYAIRGRSYYTQASKEDKCELMVKKLRYYARFIVACLLLKKVKLVKELIKELDRQIIEYGNTYEPDDQNEWRIVADEVRGFIKAEPVVTVIHPDDYPVILSHRMTPQSTPPVERSPMMTLSLQEVLIIGSNSTQVKFSELTMDMFRMMQTLEREPTGDIQHMYDESPRQRYISTPNAVNSKGYNLECGGNRAESPHKYLLFKPSPRQIFIYLASACDDLPPNGAVLLYISSEGLIVPPLKHPEDAGGYDVGGVITTSKTDIIHRETTKDGKPVPPKHKELQVLYPGDLYPFTRRPMFLIVDSDNSFIFHDLPRFFGQPLVILMSPLEQPSCLHPTSGDKRAEGSLFTLFLHCPLSAFFFCCEIPTISLSHWERAQTYIDSFLAEASTILTRSRIDVTYIAFMGDDFLRLLILRFIFCETFLRMHRLFRGRTQRTRASPPLPDDFYEHPTLTNIIIDLATHLQVRGHFHDPAAAPAPANRE